jgi:triacylglycerol esterase/lipase EstA (alpha/beta hydrolase family)
MSTTRPKRRIGRGAAIVVTVLMVAMWGYVLYLAIGPGRQPSPDRLDDPAFATSAQARCKAALADVAELPPASSSTTATDRADVLDQANAIFADMVDDLVAFVPGGDDGEITLEWLADWHTYLQDRAEWADTLRTDPKSRLLVTAKNGEQITQSIDAFAQDNRMTACGTPADA